MAATTRACVERLDETAIVQPCGALIATSDPDAGRLELPTAARRLIWDLSRVERIDAFGLGQLAEVARQARDRGVALSVRAASAIVHRLAALVKLDAVIPGAWHERRSGGSPCASSCHAVADGAVAPA